MLFKGYRENSRFTSLPIFKIQLKEWREFFNLIKLFFGLMQW